MSEALQFEHIRKVAEENSARVLAAFSKHRVSDTMFAGTTGYGYDDQGRDTLDAIYADVFGAEDALCRIQFVNGTHALFCALFGALNPGDTLLSITGAPYDTLLGAIGVNNSSHGTLTEYGVKYREVPMKDGGVDIEAAKRAVSEEENVLIYIQRSRGYGDRRALSVSEIGDIIEKLKEINPKALVMIDNCYGEFCETREPTHVGADIMAGSLIKNPGGGLAPTGGYVAGRHDLVERAAERLTVPGIGRECGSSLGNNRLLFQGFFMAPHIVAQALMTSIFAAKTFEEMGFEVSPKADDARYDIIQTIELGTPEKLKAFCRGIQSGAPCDSFVTPEPWAMPGYDDEVIMAAGAFVQGSSIELSADAPMREPYRVYLQGGITYESGRLGILRAAEEIKKLG
ncbi:MAG: methionine gamma-lyase family protein [Oscillospiraceae bacterium]|nr:methionine gamma-lyase family protein [Oscillospiraceae bacterium]